MAELKPHVFAPLMADYKWCDRRGALHAIKDMETRHIFHVVRMTWDHSVPKEHQTTFARRYRFPEFYTKEYMALTIKLMLPVLLLRKDLEPYMIYWIEFIRNKVMGGETPQVPFIRMISNGVAPQDSDRKASRKTRKEVAHTQGARLLLGQVEDSS